MGKSTISMVIFNSYVKLPEGRKHPEQRGIIDRYWKSSTKSKSKSPFRHRKCWKMMEHADLARRFSSTCSTSTSMVVHSLFQRWKYRAELDTPTGPSHVTSCYVFFTWRPSGQWLSCSTFFSAGVQSVQWVIQHISSFNIPRTDDSVRHIGINLSFKDPKNHDQFSHLIWVRFPGISWGLSQKPRDHIW